MNGAFPLLSDPDYITYIGPLSIRGANPTTHLAEVRYPVQSAPIISVVKAMPPTGLLACNEAIAWLLLRATGLPSPRNAGVMTLTESKAVKVMGRKAIPAALVREGHVLLWTAQKLDFSSIKALFAGTKGDARWVALLKTVQGAAIAAFDEALLNLDRNTGNVLYISADACAPIDHELSFGTQDWIHHDLLHLPTDGDSLRTLKHGVASGKLAISAYAEALNRMVFHAERHGQALQACSAHIADFLSRVFPDQHEEMTERVLSFVAARTAQQWIKDRLGVV